MNGTPGPDFGLHARILASLVPGTEAMALYTPSASLLWASTDSELRELGDEVRAAIGQLRAGGRGAPAGCVRLAGDAPVYCCALRDASGALAAVVGMLFPVGTRLADLPPFDSVLDSLSAPLALLARELDRHSGTIEAERLQVADTVMLQRLADITDEHADWTSGDPIDSTLASCVRTMGCDFALVHVPGRGFERIHSGVDDPEAAAELQTIARNYLLRLAAMRRRTSVLNKLRERSDSDPLPFRVVCVPLQRRDHLLGILVAANRTSRPAFSKDDGRLLERLAPRVASLIDVHIDELTGMLSRRAFETLAARSLSQDGRSRCLVYCDLDQLHVVNDLFGFAAGDAILRRMGKLLSGIEAPHGTLLARLAGDRFVAFLDQCTLNRGRTWAEAARQAITAEPPPESGKGLTLSASFGVVLVAPGTTLEHCLAAAETACKAAKDRGRNRVEVYADTDASLMQRHEDVRVFRELTHALDQGRFRIFAQPIVPLSGARDRPHHELLVRLVGSNGDLTTPAHFLSAATRYQMLPQLDRWVVAEVLSMLKPHATLLQEIGAQFSINISGPSIGQPEFADFVRTAIKTSGLPGSMLAFEITESAAIGHLDAANRLIQRMRELGCTFSLDDFGTGLSSLAYLNSLDVASIKIDGAFVRDLLKDDRSEWMVRAVVQIAEQLKLNTVAEFVESQEVADRLRELGVACGQGYFFAKPRPLSDVLQSMIEAQAARSAPPELAVG